MARIVMKFGGTSVGSVERIKNVAQRVKAEVDNGNEVAVVVSAMSGETNRLVALAQDISPMHDAREYDVVVAAGEQVSCGLLAMALQDIGIQARSFMAGKSRCAPPTFIQQPESRKLMPACSTKNLPKAIRP